VTQGSGERGATVGWSLLDREPTSPRSEPEGTPLFRRHSPEATNSEPVVKPGGKGRPTPSRKEAEAAARERAKLTRKNPKAAARSRQREQRSMSSRKMREAMKSGDERFLPARDKGPVRRFVRDLIDTRLTFGDFMLPVFLVILLLGSGLAGDDARIFANALMLPLLLFAVVDMTMLRLRVRRQVRKRFPDESLKGLTLYAITRALNMRFLRLPKPQVKIGQALPEHYR